MGTIVISENTTLDGVVQDPTGDDGFAHGGWFNRIGDDDRRAWAELGTAEALHAEALLLGRRTYEYLAARWPSRTGTWADRLNGMPKYVVSSRLDDPAWSGSEVLTGDAVDAVAALKGRLQGEIVVAGSRQLARTLLEHDLVDELRLIVYPFVLGSGDRLLGGTGDPTALHLVEARTLGTDLALLTYRASGTA
jgi:dihydrofolate reductase